MLSHDAAQIDPYRLTQKLVQKASGQGLRTFDATEVIRCQHKHKELVLTTNRGHRIKTRKLVFAAGYESQQYLKEKIVTLKSTYAVASQPLDDIPSSGSIVSDLGEGATLHLFADDERLPCDAGR